MRKQCLLLAYILASAACGSDDVDSDEEARRAYLGLDKSVEKSITLGFVAYNTTQGASIPPDTVKTMGTESGTLVITGSVDKGASANKTMKLSIGMVDYNDGDFAIDDKGHVANITYDTSTEMASQPALDMMLMNVPTGTLTGTLVGTYHLSGDIEGDCDLNLTINGMLQSDGQGGVQRMPGSTTVTGTAKSGDGTYNVNVKI